MNEYRLKLEEHLKNNKVICPNEDCKCEDIGIDNWGMFVGERDWFYYCKKCDDTFNPIIEKDVPIKLLEKEKNKWQIINKIINK